MDVVHSHDFYTNIFGMFGARLAGTPVRIASRRETTGTRTAAQKKIERFAYSLSHAIIANAKAVRSQLLSEGIRSRKIEIIYNGVATPNAKRPAEGENRAIRARFGLPRDRQLVTMVANLKLPVKDHPMFLRAACRVKNELPNAAFILAGEGKLTGEIRALAGSLGIGPDLFFTGRCEDVATLLSVSDVGVLSSKAEGFSNSILEYMAAGKPVVATKVGGAEEVVIEGETGYLVASGNDHDMAIQILKLLQDPQMAMRMGEAGRLIVERGFSCTAQLARTENLYDRLSTHRRTESIPNTDWPQPSESHLQSEHSLNGK
jgi:glycosyltransferase involved in cell wall biosynthesis